MNVNNCVFVGNVCQDPEVKTLNGGKKVAGFRLAVNRSYKKGDDWVEDPMFIDCEAWTVLADKVERSVSRGTKVFVRGRLANDEWTNKETGERRSKHKIYVLELQAARDSKRGDPQSGSSSNSGNASEGFNGDDLPF